MLIFNRQKCQEGKGVFMSAFVVSNYHITGLLSFARSLHYGINVYNNKQFVCTIDRKTDINEMSKIGQILLDQNYHSVNTRYKENDSAPAYRFKPILSRQFKAVEILKACNCYDYQACEDDDYDKTNAHAIIDAIRHSAINRLPDYDNADGWTLREPPTKSAEIFEIGARGLIEGQ